MGGWHLGWEVIDDEVRVRGHTTGPHPREIFRTFNGRGRKFIHAEGWSDDPRRRAKVWCPVKTLSPRLNLFERRTSVEPMFSYTCIQKSSDGFPRDVLSRHSRPRCSRKTGSHVIAPSGLMGTTLSPVYRFHNWLMFDRVHVLASSTSATY